MKRIIIGLVVVFALALVSLSTPVLAADCNADLTAIVGSSCTIPGNTTLVLNGTYVRQLNGTGAGAIQITGNNVTLDCNNSIIFGNNTNNGVTGLYGIVNQNSNNTVIKNCIVSNYDRAFFFRRSRNFTLDNVNVSFSRLGLLADFFSDNSTIKNSYFHAVAFANFINNASDINITNNSYLNISDSAVRNDPSTTLGGRIYNNKMDRSDADFILANSLLSDLYVYDNNVSNSDGFMTISVGAANNLQAYNNVITNMSDWWGFNMKNISNSSIRNNNISLVDYGISLSEYSYNVTIANNIINNSYLHVDNWDAAIVISSQLRLLNTYIRDISIVNNTIINFGCTGIVLRDFYNSTITGNTFTQNYADILPKSFDCSNEPLTGIFISQVYKGFVPAGTQAGDNYTIISVHQNSNITIAQNTFNNINVPLRIQGGSTINHDITNYWFFSWQDPYLADKEEWYISNDFTNVSGILPRGNLTTVLKQGINGNWNFNFTLFQTYRSFTGVFTSPLQANFYNLDNSLIYFNNGSVVCQSVADCDGNRNITLGNKNISYVLDNFKLIQGTSRPFNPLWFAEITDTERVISSNLSRDINGTVVINLGSYTCEDVSEIDYQTDSNEDFSVSGELARSVCRSLASDGSTLSIADGSENSTLTFTFAANSLATRVMYVVVGLLAIALLLFAVGGFMYYANDGFDEISVLDFTKFSILLLLATILIIVLMTYIVDVI